jgi:hypothetical protein
VGYRGPVVGSARARVFRYEGMSWSDGELTGTYSLDDHVFSERIGFEGGPAEPGPALAAALRLVYLLAGISYYKAGAPPVVDLGEVAVTDTEREFLRLYYVRGLGEFAYQAGLLTELQSLRLEGPSRTAAPAPAAAPVPVRPLVPFGGGIDSIVVVEETRRRHPDSALFVASRAGARFEAIETAAAATGLPVRRADRELDPQILRSRQLGFLNGHIPVTGIVSAMAVTAAVIDGRTPVVMSNEWSASSDTLQSDGVPVNHQWSKSLEFETAFRAVLAENLPGVEYYSALRPYSELWVAHRFADLERYHPVFRSCNRAFHLDPAQRLDRWCGRCDKCCFIDLVLAPFLDAERLAEIFDGDEPLRTPDLEPVFLSLLGDPGYTKPFECVGDVQECRVAAVLAAERADRAGDLLVQRLADVVRGQGPVPAAAGLFEPLSASFLPAPAR